MDFENEESDDKKYSEGDIIEEKDVDVNGEPVINIFELVYDYNNDCLVKTFIETKKNSKKKTKGVGDWQNFGFNKKYKGDFDIEKAIMLLYTSDENGNADEKSQKEAISYAVYFARKNVDAAKNFIVCNCINDNSGLVSDDVKDFAFSGFYLFFRNYLRNAVEHHYNKLTKSANLEKRKDAIQHLWNYVLETIKDFDPNIAKLNTFYSFVILEGEIQQFDINQTGQKISRPTYNFFSKVSTVMSEIEARKETPSLDYVTLCFNEKYNSDKKPEAIKNAMEWVISQNSLISIDSEEGENELKSQSQHVFANPEKEFIKKEKSVKISNVIKLLTPLQQQILLLKYGMAIDNMGNLYDTGECFSNNEISRELNVSEAIILSEYKIIENVFRNSYFHEERVDKFLSGRTPIFTEEENEFDLKEFLSGVDDITFEDVTGKFTRPS